MVRMTGVSRRGARDRAQDCSGPPHCPLEGLTFALNKTGSQWRVLS